LYGLNTNPGLPATRFATGIAEFTAIAVSLAITGCSLTESLNSEGRAGTGRLITGSSSGEEPQELVINTAARIMGNETIVFIFIDNYSIQNNESRNFKNAKITAFSKILLFGCVLSEGFSGDESVGAKLLFKTLR
jgi:hypothetical protein